MSEELRGAFALFILTLLLIEMIRSLIRWRHARKEIRELTAWNKRHGGES